MHLAKEILLKPQNLENGKFIQVVQNVEPVARFVLKYVFLELACSAAAPRPMPGRSLQTVARRQPAVVDDTLLVLPRRSGERVLPGRRIASSPRDLGAVSVIISHLSLCGQIVLIQTSALEQH